MTETHLVLQALSDGELLRATRALVARQAALEADLLAHLAEIDARKLYLEHAAPSLFVFCTDELGLSGDAAYTRIEVMRAARRHPAVLEALRSGAVHLTGLRLLAPHLTDVNCTDVLAEATGKSKRKIQEIVARLAPKPDVPAMIRRLPTQRAASAAAGIEVRGPGVAPAPGAAEVRVTTVQLPPAARRSSVTPLAEETFKVQFTVRRALRDKLRTAQDLLRHRIRDGDLASIFEAALDLLIERVKKERFASGCKPRAQAKGGVTTRHVPNAVRREVFERDGGRCTFTDASGKRCRESGGLELDHIDGFARTREHDPTRMRLLCRAHNQHAADQMYGAEFMSRKRNSAENAEGMHPTCSGTS